MDQKEQSTWMDDITTGKYNAADAAIQENRAMEVQENTAMGAPGDETAAQQGRYTVVNGGAAAETEETKRLRENYGVIAPAALGYGIFYVLCMYGNGSGITFPLFVVGSLLFFCFVLFRVGIPGGTRTERDMDTAEVTRSWLDPVKAGTRTERNRLDGGKKIGLKKGSWFYVTAMLLLGVSTFCTDDSIMIFFNKLGVFLLLMSLLLKQFFDTSNWKLGKYLGSICIMLGASFGELGRPFTDRALYNKGREKKTDRKTWYIALGLLIGIPLLLIVLLLLASADAVFRQMTGKLLQIVNFYDAFHILVRIAILFFGAYALTAYLCKKKIREDVADKRRGEPVLAITVTGLLTLLYLFFSVIQIVGLFLGRLRLPEGYTYAMYAREGFFQLLAVSLLNLILVLGCMSFFKESKVLKAVLTVMSLCTFIMIASSFMRMIMYIRYYYLTYLRILVLWALVLLAVLFTGVVTTIFRENFPLFRFSMAVVAVLYLGLSFAHPDYIIARVNVTNASHGEMLSSREMASETEISERKTSGAEEGDSGEREGFFLAKEPYQDYVYLRTLSADAAPVLVPYLRELGYDMEAFQAEDAVDYAEDAGILEIDSEYSHFGQKGFGYYWMRKIQRRTEAFGIRTYNVSRHRALTELSAY